MFGSHSFPPFFAALAFFLCFSYSLFCSSQKSQVHSWNASHHNSSNINFRSFLCTCIPPPPTSLSLSFFSRCVCVCLRLLLLPSFIPWTHFCSSSFFSILRRRVLADPDNMWLQMFILSSEDFLDLILNSDTPLSLVTIAESPWRAKGEHRVVVADWETRRGWPLLIIEMVDFKNSSHQ